MAISSDSFVDDDRTRLTVLRTRYPHWGRHAGMHQFIRHLPADRYRISESLVTDGDDDFIIRSPFVRRPLRKLIGLAGMSWYALSDVDAELRMVIPMLRRRVDALHYLDGEHTAQFLPPAASWLSGGTCRTIATFHQPPALLATLVRKAVLRRLDAVTVVAPSQLGFFERLVPESRLHVVLHGVDVEFFRPASRTREGGPFSCLTVGHHLRDFGAIGAVARSLATDTTVRFDIVSPGPTGLESLANVRHHRHVSDDNLLSLYQCADVLLLPVLDSTANNALLEGIACGLPVISTAHPAVRTYLPGDEAMLVDDNAVEGIRAAIFELRDGAGGWALRSLAARRRAEELAWPRIAPQFDAIYRAVTA